jgi:hypothetical protein
LSKDWENLNRKAQAFLLMASIRFMVRMPGLEMFPDRWGDWGLSPVIRWLPLSG